MLLLTKNVQEKDRLVLGIFSFSNPFLCYNRNFYWLILYIFSIWSRCTCIVLLFSNHIMLAILWAVHNIIIIWFIDGLRAWHRFSQNLLGNVYGILSRYILSLYDFLTMFALSNLPFFYLPLYQTIWLFFFSTVHKLWAWVV